MNNPVRSAHARAVVCFPAELLDDTTERKYPAYIGLLIATAASVLLWAIIASVAASIF